MALPNIFSRRLKASSGSASEIYAYDNLPENVRVQIIQIWQEAIGSGYSAISLYDDIVGLLRKELGVFELANVYGKGSFAEISRWFIIENRIEYLVDAIEIALWGIDKVVRAKPHNFPDRRIDPSDAIEELNARLLEASIGYQYNNGMVIRVDSTLLHKEVVVPTLTLLADPKFAAVDQEYREAHAKFRTGDYEGSLVDCAKAFESTLKVIGAQRGWIISPNDTSSKLLAAAYIANFIPQWMQAEFTALRALLEGAVPTVRNKQGGHGAGTTARTVPKELAAFQIHQAAAAILFLIEHHKANP